MKKVDILTNFLLFRLVFFLCFICFETPKPPVSILKWSNRNKHLVSDSAKTSFGSSLGCFDTKLVSEDTLIHADAVLWMFWMHKKHPLSIFKIQMIIWMILELKHKNFKDQCKINAQLKKNNFRRHMSILVAFKWHYFQAILNWWHSSFKNVANRISRIWKNNNKLIR
jgi:hypothetical protein